MPRGEGVDEDALGGTGHEESSVERQHVVEDRERGGRRPPAQVLEFAARASFTPSLAHASATAAASSRRGARPPRLSPASTRALRLLRVGPQPCPRSEAARRVAPAHGDAAGTCRCSPRSHGGSAPATRPPPPGARASAPNPSLAVARATRAPVRDRETRRERAPRAQTSAGARAKRATSKTRAHRPRKHPPSPRRDAPRSARERATGRTLDGRVSSRQGDVEH